jgi:hypothetical protein
VAEALLPPVPLGTLHWQKQKHKKTNLYTKEWIEWVLNPAELASKKTTIYTWAYLLPLGKMENFATALGLPLSLQMMIVSALSLKKR